VLFAALDVQDGGIAGWVTDSTKSENFVDLLADLVRQTPKGLDLHCIADNLSAHKTGAVATFLEKNPHVHIHYTPTHASWLNQVWVNRPWEVRLAVAQRRIRIGRGADRSHHRIHQGLQQKGVALPVDLRRSTTTCRVNHNDLGAEALVTGKL
jgi:hypothetical protein